MQSYLNVVEIVVSVVLIVMLIAQSRGSGFTGTTQDQTTVFRTRRGIEKTREGTPALLEFITEKAVDVSRFG